MLAKQIKMLGRVKKSPESNADKEVKDRKRQRQKSRNSSDPQLQDKNGSSGQSGNYFVLYYHIRYT